MELVKNNGETWKLAMTGDDEGLTRKVLMVLKSKLRYNNRIDQRLIDHNVEELRKMSKRTADRIIEIVELYDPDWFKDSSNRPPQYDPINPKAITNSTIAEWLNGMSGWGRSWGGYWDFIHDKVIGEI